VSTQAKTLLTPQQYLEIERKAPNKSEYWRGVMFAMAGASREHNVIVVNLVASLHEQLRGRRCEVYSSEMRVFIPRTGLYTYPDVIVVCGDRRFTDDHGDTLENPTFLAEILSPSTEGYDRGRKSEHYRTIESLREYLLVAQDRIHLDLYRRQPDGAWVLQEASRLQDTLDLPSIGCRVVVADIYERLELPASNPQASA